MKEKIKKRMAEIESRLETLEKDGNEKIKAAGDKIAVWAAKNGINGRKGIIIILAAALIFFTLTGDMFKVSFRPLKVTWINPVTSIQKAFKVNKKGRFNR